jgi:hypothetical protein
LLRNSIPFDAPQYNGYVAKAFDASRRDPDVKEAVRAWSTCMKRGGFDYRDPSSSAGDTDWAKTTRPYSRELATAAADVGCKKETRLVTIWAKADTRIQQAVIRDHAGDFHQFAETKTAGYGRPGRHCRETPPFLHSRRSRRALMSGECRRRKVSRSQPITVPPCIEPGRCAAEAMTVVSRSWVRDA